MRESTSNFRFGAVGLLAAVKATLFVQLDRAISFGFPSGITPTR
jgi:hypothetical protein